MAKMWQSYDDHYEGTPGRPLVPKVGRANRPTPATAIQRNTQPVGPEPEAHTILRLDAQICRQKVDKYTRWLKVWEGKENVNCDMVRLAIDDLIVAATRLEAAMAGKEVKG